MFSELYRQFLLSRAGTDGLLGTGDDKPFRSFAISRLSETLLRRAHFTRLDRPSGEPWDPNAPIFPAPMGEMMIETAGAPYNTTPGQFTPRLFDPIPDPYPSALAAADKDRLKYRGELVSPYDGNIDPANPGSNYNTNYPDPDPMLRTPQIDYWMLETRQNKLLAKIAGNVTSRSNVYAVWMTVGYFRVEPGTENLSVPLLNEEVGINDGTNIRHRFFFIVDRSRARHYDGPINPPIETNPLLILPSKVSFVE